jgi:Ca-activated chloride channel homolog
VSFEAPLLLVLLLVVPAAAFAVIWLERRRAQHASAWAPPGLLENMVTSPPPWRRYLPIALLLVGLTLLLVGFARPQATVHEKRQDATVVLVIDVSGSMAANDAPPTRLGAVKKAVASFVAKLPKGYRMAVVTFTDHAAVVQPPTRNLQAVRAVVARAKTGDQGTALGEAVVRGVAVARTVKPASGQKHPPAVVVVFSDGGQTAGLISPQQAGRRALQARIPVSAVSVGTPDGIVVQKLQGGFSERIQVPAQPASLQTIAQTSLGHFYPHVIGVDPAGIYKELGSRVGKEPKRVEVTAGAAAGAIVFMLAGGLLSGAWFRRVP